MTFFTDWTLTDPHYFYGRGALFGFVAATLFWKLLIPWLKHLTISEVKMYKLSRYWNRLAYLIIRIGQRMVWNQTKRNKDILTDELEKHLVSLGWKRWDCDKNIWLKPEIVKRQKT